MGINHDIFSSGAVTFTNLTPNGSFAVNQTVGGTGAPIYAGNHDYHAVFALGSFGNTGTIFVYGHFNSSGGGTTVLGSAVFGSGNFPVAAFDLRTDTLTALGTVGSGTYYTHLSGQVRVDSGGTFTGMLGIMSYNARSAGTTPAAVGVGALGTRYA